MRLLKWPDRRSLEIDGYRFRSSRVHAMLRADPDDGCSFHRRRDEMKNEIREHPRQETFYKKSREVLTRY